MPMNVATYTRVSTAEQSVEAQTRELVEYVRQRGWNVAEQFSDTISGAKKDRPGLDALMQGAAEERFQAILCVKLDRMARSLSHLAQLVETLDKAGVALICTSQGIDTSKSNACGRLQWQVLAAVAQFERELIRERTRAGLAVVKANGKQLGKPSVRMPRDENARKKIIEEWRLTGDDRNYCELGQMLGGVSASTAWRLERKLKLERVP